MYVSIFLIPDDEHAHIFGYTTGIQYVLDITDISKFQKTCFDFIVDFDFINKKLSHTKKFIDEIENCLDNITVYHNRDSFLFTNHNFICINFAKTELHITRCDIFDGESYLKTRVKKLREFKRCGHLYRNSVSFEYRNSVSLEKYYFAFPKLVNSDGNASFICRSTQQTPHNDLRKLRKTGIHTRYVGAVDLRPWTVLYHRNISTLYHELIRNGHTSVLTITDDTFPEMRDVLYR